MLHFRAYIVFNYSERKSFITSYSDVVKYYTSCFVLYFVFCFFLYFCTPSVNEFAANYLLFAAPFLPSDSRNLLQDCTKNLRSNTTSNEITADVSA